MFDKIYLSANSNPLVQKKKMASKKIRDKGEQ